MIRNRAQALALREELLTEMKNLKEQLSELTAAELALSAALEKTTNYTVKIHETVSVRAIIPGTAEARAKQCTTMRFTFAGCGWDSRPSDLCIHGYDLDYPCTHCGEMVNPANQPTPIKPPAESGRSPSTS